MNTKHIIAFMLISFFAFIGLVYPVFAQGKDFSQDSFFQQETLEATVTEILEEKEIQFPDLEGEKQLYQKLELLVTKGSLIDREIIIESGDIPIASLQKYKSGDNVVVFYSKSPEGDEYFYISDYVRRAPLFLLLIIFVVVTLIIAKWRGFSSILGMGFSFLVIFKFILPKILAGANPISVAIIGSFFIIPITFYLSHGLNKKTTVAILGTIISLVITGILAGVFVDAAKLTGFASEEAGFLQVFRQGQVNIKGILLAGIIIGVLGVLDDVTVSQSAIVFQLKKVNSNMKSGQLYKKAMDVGKDHISSMVNTLVLVYTGASLPLLLLFIDNPHPFLEVINYEILADEIVRTLVGSIGLVLAVPITTFIACLSVVEHNSKNS